MRDFFIRSFEVLVGVIIVLLAIGIVLAAAAVAFSDGAVVQGLPAGGGPLAGLAVLVGGFIYLIFVGGLMYLGLGIYQNTRRAADALERWSGRP